MNKALWKCVVSLGTAFEKNNCIVVAMKPDEYVRQELGTEVLKPLFVLSQPQKSRRLS